MRLDENELRSALKNRRFQTGAKVWPSLEARLEASPRQRARTAIWWALAVVALVALAVAIGLRRTSEPVELPPSVQVLNAKSLGRPAGVLVLQPDAKTVLIVLE
ncbi:MAG: hypothetical protein ACHQPI_08385 [Thermoanaerobaculia bacterium]